MLAALASQNNESEDFQKFPDWAKQIITRIRKPPALDFEENYSDVQKSPQIDEEIENALTKKDKALIKLAKIELDRLTKRVQASTQ